MTGALSGVRVLVTGGSRTIGATLVDQLVRRQATDIVLVDILARDHRRSLGWADAYPELTLVNADLRNSELIGALTQGADLLFHQAGIPEPGEDPRLAVDRLVDGISTVFGAAARAGVCKVILGSLTPDPRQDTDGSDQVTCFAEGLLRSLRTSHGLDYVALRYADVYGPRVEAHELFGATLVSWMQCIDAGQPPLVPGNGAQRKDPVFIGDVARANVLAAEAPVTGEVCHVGTGARTSLRRLATTLLKVMEAPLNPVSGPPPVAAPSERRARVAPAQRLLGFQPETSLEDGLRQLVVWWRGQRHSQRTLAGARSA
jgi:UDP-glucose 4-epimerase